LKRENQEQSVALQTLRAEIKRLTDQQETLFNVTSSAGNLKYVKTVDGREKPSAFVPVLFAKKSASQLVQGTGVEDRALNLFNVLSVTSGGVRGTGAEDEDLVCLLSKVMKMHPEIAIPAFQDSSLSTADNRLTPGATLDLKLLIDLTYFKFCQLKLFLKKHNCDILSSEREIREEISPRGPLTKPLPPLLIQVTPPLHCRSVVGGRL
jgi:hypothetical protein